MNNLKMTVVPLSTCWCCGVASDHASGEGASPTPGDWALCIKCGALGVYTDDITLRQPTDAERAAARLDANVARFREALAKAKGQLATTKGHG